MRVSWRYVWWVEQLYGFKQYDNHCIHVLVHVCIGRLSPCGGGLPGEERVACMVGHRQQLQWVWSGWLRWVWLMGVVSKIG